SCSRRRRDPCPWLRTDRCQLRRGEPAIARNGCADGVETVVSCGRAVRPSGYGGAENRVQRFGLRKRWWAYLDLNQGPLPYQGSALTVLSYTPEVDRTEHYRTAPGDPKPGWPTV